MTKNCKPGSAHAVRQIVCRAVIIIDVIYRKAERFCRGKHCFECFCGSFSERITGLCFFHNAGNCNELRQKVTDVIFSVRCVFFVSIHICYFLCCYAIIILEKPVNVNEVIDIFCVIWYTYFYIIVYQGGKADECICPYKFKNQVIQS